MKNFYLMSLMFFSSYTGTQAKSFIDNELQLNAKNTIIDIIKPYGADISEVSILVMKSTGEVIVNLGVGLHNGKHYKEIPTLNFESIPFELTRSLQYLCLAEVSSDFVVDAAGGYYVDSASHCTIMDENRGLGGYQKITTDRAMDVSNVGLYKAMLATYGKNMRVYSEAIRRSGVLFTTDSIAVDGDKSWVACEIMARSPYTMLQQVAWLSGILLNTGRIVYRLTDSDSAEPVCTSMNSEKAIERLKKAMILAVESGSARALKTRGIEIGAILNVSEPDATECHTASGFACLPMNNAGGYTIGVQIRKHGPTGRNLPNRILKRVIDYMLANGYVITTDGNVKYHPHPAEKGR